MAFGNGCLECTEGESDGMSKFDEVMTACKAQMQTAGIDCDEKLLASIAKGLGPSLYNRDTNRVTDDNKTELDNVKTRFISRKLGVDGTAADAAIEHAIEHIGSTNQHKLRPVFYYLIVKHLHKESVYHRIKV